MADLTLKFLGQVVQGQAVQFAGGDAGLDGWRQVIQYAARPSRQARRILSRSAGSVTMPMYQLEDWLGKIVEL